VYMPRLLHYMGRRADPNLDAAHWTGIAKAYLGSKEPWWKKPPEDWRQGCPGAWIRSPFNYSFSRYARGRDDNGGRVQNHHLDSCKDWLVIDGVHYFEREENRRIAFHEKVAWEAIDAKRRSAQGNKR